MAGSSDGQSTVDEGEAIDPLELHKLSLNLDYLIYKIKDNIETLTEQTYNSIVSKEKAIDEEYLQGQLHLQHEYNHCDVLLQKCNQLENDFSKLQQLYSFVDGFKVTIEQLELEFEELERMGRAHGPWPRGHGLIWFEKKW